MPNLLTIVFDLGGVLIDWNPRYLYSKIFQDPQAMEDFLENVCDPQWNAQQDAGRPLDEATHILLEKHPRFKEEISAYYGRWQEMLNGSIPGTVTILKELHRKQFRLLALTNWSHETFPVARELFDFLGLFEGIVVSGTEKLKKPDPRIYQVLFQRYQLTPSQCMFIDDSLPNIEAANSLGMRAIHFQSPESLKARLQEMGIVLN